MERRAKIFMNGRSQAVRLPADFRFETNEVFVRRDERTGDVILSSQPSSTWQAFMALRDALGPLPEGFLSPSERAQPTEARDPFADLTP